MTRSARARALLAQPWTLTFAAVSVLIVVLHLADLNGSPPGLYNDEASIGYNAWAVAHYGVDEHGAHLPLFFQAFGEYKNPVYIYLLAPFTLVFPLTAYVVRLPAALFGLLICAAAAMAAWHLTRSRRVTLLVLITAAIEPWTVQESRLGFEVISQVALLMVVIWFLVRADREDSPRWFGSCGVALALSVIAYSTGRLVGAMVMVIVAICYLTPARRRVRSWAWMLVPMIGVYVSLLVYNSRNPGALTARFGSISIGWDNPGFATLVGRFVANYVTYWGVPFLATHGDGNPRHNPGFGGMLLVSTLPAIILGAAICIRRFRDDTLCRILVLGALAAPLPAAITAEATPHSLRAASMLPFLLAFSIFGWQALVRALSARHVAALALAAAVAVESGAFFYDLYVEYPGRALGWFDAGQGDAIAAAARLAQGHEVWLSDQLDAAYIQVLFALEPDPHAYVRDGLDAVHMRIASASAIAAGAQPGDIIVLMPTDPVPSGAQVVLREEQTVGTGPAMIYQPASRTVELAVVARR